MIITDSGLNGIIVDLAHLDESAEATGFVRWQWEYYRATYDLKLFDNESNETYYARINTRVTEGKLESPEALLQVEAVYIGRSTFPHGMEYESEIPKAILDTANKQLKELQARIA